MRLQKRLVFWSEEAGKKTKRQQLIADEAKVELIHAKEDAEKAKSEAEEAKWVVELLRQEVEKSKVRVEKIMRKENQTEKFDSIKRHDHG